MEEGDLSRYENIVACVTDRYSFKFSPERKIAFLSLNENLISKVDGLRLAFADYVLINDHSRIGSMGDGFDVRGRLYEASDQEIERVVIEANRITFKIPAKERSALLGLRGDIKFLKLAETALYKNGFVLPQEIPFNPSMVRKRLLVS